MDRKSILVIALSLGLIVLWQVVLVPKLYPPKVIPAGSSNQVASASNTVPSSAPGMVAGPTSAPVRPVTSLVEQLVVVTNGTSVLTFTSHGGGLKEVGLRKYPAIISRDRKTNSGPQAVATLNAGAQLPALSLLGGAALEGDGIYALTQVGAGVRAEKALPGGLVIIQEFLPSSNYLISVSTRLENRGSQPLLIPEHQFLIGTSTPLTPHDLPLNQGAMWHDGATPSIADEGWFANRTLGCIPGTPRTEYRAGNSNVVWGEVHNQFFTIAVIPATNQPPAAVYVKHLDLPPPSRAVVEADSRTNLKPVGYQAGLVYPAQSLAPGEAVFRGYTVYAGPKEYDRVANIGTELNNNLDALMNFGRFFGFFARILLIAMNGLHGLGLSYGLAIIAITVIIKLLFWPLTNASTKSMKRMAALQPQMKAIAEKYKDDPQKKNLKTMEFMKEHKVSPVAGCIPIFIQIPVFIGFYTMLNSAIELRGASFLWAFDLSQPDYLFTIPGLGLPFHLMPFFWAASTWWQTSLTPTSPGMDPAQQKMMKFMPFMFFFFLYSTASGLTVYWTVQNLLSVLQTKITKAGEDPANKAKTAVIVKARK